MLILADPWAHPTLALGPSSKCMQMNPNRSYFGIPYGTMTLITSLSMRTSGQTTDWLLSVAGPLSLKISRNASSCPSFTVSSRLNHGSDASAWRSCVFGKMITRNRKGGEDQSYSLERQASHSSFVFDVFFLPYPVNLILAERPLR